MKERDGSQIRARQGDLGAELDARIEGKEILVSATRRTRILNVFVSYQPRRPAWKDFWRRTVRQARGIAGQCLVIKRAVGLF
jgi:hypothetical protein